MEKLGIQDLDLKGKKVLVRVDFNVPLDEKQNIIDDTRIRESLPTIRYIMQKGGKPILISHLGRPKGVDPRLSLFPVAVKLEELLEKKVIFVKDCVGPEVKKAVDNLRDEVLLLENLRFHPEEEKNAPNFARDLAGLADLFVNDAFGTVHRAHASTAGVNKYLTSAAGFLVQKEIQFLGKALANPERPFVAILGGAKISGKIEVITNLMEKVDKLLIGGGMVYNFLQAEGYSVGDSLLEENKIGLAKDILSRVKTKNIPLILPVDFVIADAFRADARTQVVSKGNIPVGWRGMDIGPRTVELFRQELKNAQTVVWNGPLGVFEFSPFSQGTNAIARVLADLTSRGVTTIIGGGDTAAAIVKAGLSDRVSHISTGGGASLEFLEGKVLPGIAALSDKC